MKNETATQIKISQVRVLIHQALKLTDQIHEESASMWSHNCSIDLEVALRSAITPMLALYRAETPVSVDDARRAENRQAVADLYTAAARASH